MPVCFMIMPYGRNATQADAGRGPAEIDFNALWDNGYVPSPRRSAMNRSAPIRTRAL